MLMIKQEILKDLVEIREKLDSIIETLEIMSDEELMESIKRAREQPPKRDFEDFLREIGIDTLSMSN
jgi:uncharacterized protein YqgV (UPF0045/DUF77 family)